MTIGSISLREHLLELAIGSTSLRKLLVKLAIDLISLSTHLVKLAIGFIAPMNHLLKLAIGFIAPMNHLLKLAMGFVSLMKHLVKLAIGFISLMESFIKLVIALVSLTEELVRKTIDRGCEADSANRKTTWLVVSLGGVATLEHSGEVQWSKVALLGALACLGGLFALLWTASLRAAGRHALRPSAYEIFVGAVTDFFDTLGIGSFAPTAALFKARAAVPDQLIPGTLNVGHTVPTLIQAFVYIAIVRVEPATLALMVAAAAAGAWVGAGFVASWPKRSIQRGLGAALVGAALLLTAQQLHVLPMGGEALGLHGGRLAVAVACNAVLGAWMTLGVGLYGPCMVLVCLLGMNATAAFPIMMGSCAFLMPVASARFLSRKAYAPRAAVGLTLGGAPAVVVAALVVRSLPLGAIRWLVVAAVLVAAWTMLRTSMRGES